MSINWNNNSVLTIIIILGVFIFIPLFPEGLHMGSKKSVSEPINYMHVYVKMFFSNTCHKDALGTTL